MNHTTVGGEAYESLRSRRIHGIWGGAECLSESRAELLTWQSLAFFFCMSEQNAKLVWEITVYCTVHISDSTPYSKWLVRRCKPTDAFWLTGPDYILKHPKFTVPQNNYEKSDFYSLLAMSSSHGCLNTFRVKWTLGFPMGMMYSL